MSNSHLPNIPTIRGSGQVVQTAFSNTTAISTITITTAGVYQDSGLACSITPTSAGSTIMGKFTGCLESSTGDIFVKIVRDSTSLVVNDSSAIPIAAYAVQTNNQGHISFPFIDDQHNSTSSITYKVYVTMQNNGEDVCIGYNHSNTDANTFGRFPTSLILKERL